MTLFESAALGLVLAALVVRPSELPAMGRKAGRLAGRAMNRFQSMRRELGEYVEKNELGSVQEELEQTMGQLNKIRQDFRSVSSVRGIVMGELGGRRREGGGQGRDVWEGATVAASNPAGQEPRKSRQSTNPREYKRMMGQEDEEIRRTSTTVLPISARDVRHARDVRGDDVDESTGSGILKATLEEERVAKAAAEFFDRRNARDQPKA